MRYSPLGIIALCLMTGLYAGMVPTCAEAATHHRHHHKSSHHRTSLSKQTVKTAQRHLIDLGYLTGHADGVLGPRTKLALKKFQRDHGLPATGALTTLTYNELVKADIRANGLEAATGHALTSRDLGPMLASGAVPDFYATHPDFYGHVNQQYSDPMLLSSTVIGDANNPGVRSQSIPSRFAKIDVSENAQGSTKTYTVTINGQPLLRSDDQASVIGISRTFQLNDEDAIIFSTFRNNDPTCNYKHYLLTTRSAGQNLQEIGNCTRGYQAQIDNNSLFVVFPESDDGRTVGNTWRYEDGDLERL